jgi:galactose mutarotase-like enzyme
MEASVQGQAWPYRFGRRASLAGASLRFDYEVVNEAGVALDCLWSLHPLLNVAPGMHLNLPGEVREVLVASSNVAGVEVGDCLPWPYIRPGESLACVKEPSRGWALKLFTDALREGCCELRAGREMLRVEWDVEAAPYLGLWLCYGGWPNAPDAGHYTLAIEPCSGRPDGLADADRRGECWTLAPGRTRRWWVRLTCTS